MADIEKIRMLLTEKRELLLKLEAESNAMMSCESEKLEAHMRVRQRFIERVDALDKKINERINGQPEEAQLREVLRNRCDRDGLPQELGGLYDAAQLNFSVLNRLAALNEQGAARLHAERDTLMQTIREHSQATEAQAARFHAGMEEPGGRNLLGGQKI